MEKEEEARGKTEGREQPFIPIIGRAALPGDDDGVSQAGGRDQLAFAKGATGSERAMSCSDQGSRRPRSLTADSAEQQANVKGGIQRARD